MTLQPEMSLADRYRLESRIAVGGMGEVWRAEDVLLGRIVAVKVLKSEYAEDPTFLERFRNEARHTAALSHPGIANVFDYGELPQPGGGSMAYLVMEFVDGEPLNAILAREGKLSPARALDIVGQTAIALQAAHDAGVIHRDVKPGNLIVRPDGVVKVTDFGIARAVDAVPLTQTGTVVGTAYYISPEQAAGQAVTPSSDVYSLGIVAYECLTGTRPFPGDNAVTVAMAHVREPVPQLPGVLPAPVRELVASAMAKTPAERPASAGELGRAALDLRQNVYGEAVTTVLPPPVAPAPTRAMTQVLPPVAAATVEPAPLAYERRYEPEPERRSAIPWLVLLGLVVLALLAFLLLRDTGDDEVDPGPTVPSTSTSPSPTPTPSPSAENVAVPTLEGLSEDVARERIANAGFPEPQVVREPSDSPEGEVLDQDPEAGTEADPDTRITLRVSEGPPTVTIDESDYLGRPFEEVEAELTGMDLVVERRNVRDGGGPPGSVVGVRPDGELEPGSTVTVSVKEKEEEPLPEPEPSDVVVDPTPAAMASESASPAA